jgi:hypothetical protein
MKPPRSVVGRWRFVEMDEWDELDDLGPPYIEFDATGQGCFRFMVIEGWMHVRPAAHLGPTGVEFSWEGQQELDAASGRGWAQVTDEGELVGRIYLHLSDESSFRAVRE